MMWIKDKFNELLADIYNSYKSFTIWFNGMALILIEALPMLQEQFPQVEEYLSPKVYHFILGIIVVGNILLRIKTSKALREK